MEHEIRQEIEALASMVGAEIATRVRRRLRREGATNEEAIDYLSLLCGVEAIPVVQSFLTEEDPFRAWDEVRALEEAIEG